MKAYKIHHTTEKEPPDGPAYDDCFWLERASDGECIYSDLGEPEDKILPRDLKRLVAELNRLAELIEAK